MRISDQDANRLRVLKAIRRAEPVARTELALITGLPAWAISELVADLLNRDLLVEEKSPAGGRGRPRIQLRLNAEAAHVVAAFLLPTGSLRVEIANLRGDAMFAHSYPLYPLRDRSFSLESLAADVSGLVERALAESPFERSRIHSVGLGLPGVADSLRGVLHWLPPFPPAPVPFADLVGASLGLPVFLDNAANVLTRGEHWFGSDRQVDDFALIFVGLGMASGQYVDGFLRVGGHGLNAEFSHMKMGFGDGPRCHCGARGCLGVYASLAGVAARFAELNACELPAASEALNAYEAVVEQARRGNPHAIAVFEQAGRALGVSVATYINLLDPARIQIRALDADYCELIAPSFHAALAENTVPPLRGRAPLSLELVEEAAFARGAAALVLEQLYRDPATRV